MITAKGHTLEGTLSMLIVGACALLCSGCPRPQRDYAPELVDAAGLSTNAVMLLLDRGADVNARSQSTFGWTPLIASIYHEKEDVTDLLLARGADPNVADRGGRTALMWAIVIQPENTNLLRTLVRHGADPRVKDGFGLDAFAQAAFAPGADAIGTLLMTEAEDGTE